MFKRKAITLLMSIVILIVGILVYKSFNEKELIFFKTPIKVSCYREKIANKIINNNITFLEKLKYIDMKVYEIFK